MRKSILLVLLVALTVTLVQAQSITVISPNGNERWNPGEYRNIQWNYSGLSGQVKIELLRRTITGVYAARGEIAQVQVSSQSYRWRVGDYQGGSVSGSNVTRYKIRVKTLDGRYMDESNDGFFISGVEEAVITAPREYIMDGSLLPMLFSNIKIRLDKNESWLKYTFTDSDEKTKVLDIGEFKAKDPTGVRDILHKIQDINSGYWNLNARASQINLFLRFETDGDIEIKRYAYDGIDWRDYLAYDINLTKFEFTLSFKIGGNCVRLTPDNVIHSATVNLNLEADISNAPDEWNEWLGINDKIKAEVRPRILQAFQDYDLKQSFYDALTNYLVGKIDEHSILNCVYCSGNNIIIKYSPPKL